MSRALRLPVLAVAAAGATAAGLTLPVVTLAALVGALVLPMALVMAWLGTWDPTTFDRESFPGEDDLAAQEPEAPVLPPPLPRPTRPGR